MTKDEKMKEQGIEILAQCLDSIVISIGASAMAGSKEYKKIIKREATKISREIEKIEEIEGR